MFNWVLWYLTYKDDLYKLFLYYKQNQSIDKYIFLFFIICLINGVYFLNSYLYIWNTLQVVDSKHPNAWIRLSFTCILNLVLCFTCVYIGLKFVSIDNVRMW